MKQQRLLIVLLAVVASGVLITLATVLATRGEDGPPNDRPSFAGTVTSVTPGGSFGSLLVEEFPGQQAGSKVMLTVTAQTHIFTAQGKASKAAGFAMLHAGQRVDVWVSGPVATSYPALASAATIVIRSG
jgi:hypothetical protein